MLRLLVATSCVFAAANAAAEPVRVSSAALKEMLPGALLNFDTPLRTTIPVRFSEDGLVSGKAGALGAVLGAARDRGRWWVENDRLCVKWFRWFEAKKRCVVVRQEGDMLYWRGEDRDGTAQIVERAKKPEPVVKTEVAAAPAVEPAATAAVVAETQVEATPTETDVEAAIAIMSGAPAADAAPDVQEAPAAREEPAVAESTTAAKPAPRMKFATAAAAGSVPYKLFGSAEAAPAPPAVEASVPAASTTADEPAAIEIAAAVATKPAAPVKRTAETPRAAERKLAANHAARVSSSSLIMPTSFRVSGVDPDDILNVRAGPSEFAEQIGAIPPEGRGVRIVGACQRSWCPIVHGRTKGWVNRYYLSAEETATRAAR